MAEKDLFSERAAAKALGISHGTLVRLRREGAISFYRIRGQVRYDRQDLDVFLSKAKRGGSGPLAGHAEPPAAQAA